MLGYCTHFAIVEADGYFLKIKLIFNHFWVKDKNFIINIFKTHQETNLYYAVNWLFNVLRKQLPFCGCVFVRGNGIGTIIIKILDISD